MGTIESEGSIALAVDIEETRGVDIAELPATVVGMFDNPEEAGWLSCRSVVLLIDAEPAGMLPVGMDPD